jgi:hypothetical protein
MTTRKRRRYIGYQGYAFHVRPCGIVLSTSCTPHSFGSPWGVGFPIWSAVAERSGDTALSAQPQNPIPGSGVRSSPLLLSPTRGQITNLVCGGRAQRRHRFSQFSETEESSRPPWHAVAAKREGGCLPMARRSRKARRRLPPDSCLLPHPLPRPLDYPLAAIGSARYPLVIVH